MKIADIDITETDKSRWVGIRLLAGGHITLNRDVRLGSFPTRGGADADEADLLKALRELRLIGRFGTFVRYVGGGTGWGVFLGPVKPAKN